MSLQRHLTDLKSEILKLREEDRDSPARESEICTRKDDAIFKFLRSKRIQPFMPMSKNHISHDMDKIDLEGNRRNESLINHSQSNFVINDSSSISIKLRKNSFDNFGLADVEE